MYRGAAVDPLSPPFVSAQSSSTPWIDALFPLLLLIALALMISSASTGAGAASDTPLPPSPSPVQTPAYILPPSNVAQLEETTRVPVPSQGTGSASNSTNEDSSPPGYGFNRGFDKPYQKMTILIAALFIATLMIGFCTHYVTPICRSGVEIPRLQGVAGQGVYNEGGRVGGGLDPWIVRDLPTVRYSAAPSKTKDVEGEEGDAGEGEGKRGGEAKAMAMVKQECAVCLSEFEEGEEMKALPECGHGFHSACIDMWLFSHTTCPICRLSLVKASNSKSKQPAAASRSPSRADHVAINVVEQQQHMVDPATSRGPRHVTPTWLDHVDDDVAEDARDSSARDSSARGSSAALFPHFPSS